MLILFSVGGLLGNFSLENQIIVAKKSGFDGVDYIASINDLFFGPRKIVHLTEKHKITVRAVHIPLIFVLYAPRVVFGKILKLLKFFPESQRFNFHLSGFLNPLGNDFKRLEKFKRLMEENNIKISCESNPNEYFFLKYYPKATYDPDLFAKFCITHNLPMNLDTSHIAAWNYDIVEFFKKYHIHINFMHLSDMTTNKQHLPFGEGILPLKKLFEAMRTVSYDNNGIVVLEVSNFAKNISREDVIHELKNNIKLIKKAGLS